MSKMQLYLKDVPAMQTPRARLASVREGFVRLHDGRIMYVTGKPEKPVGIHVVYTDKTVSKTSVASSLDLAQEIRYIDGRSIGIEKLVWGE